MCFLFIYSCSSRPRRSWVYCRNKGFFSTWSWPNFSQKHSASWSCCERWQTSVRWSHIGGTEQLTQNSLYCPDASNKYICFDLCVFDVSVCIGEWCRYHRIGPRGVGLYAPQYSSGRDRLSGGLTAGRHVPAQRNGKNRTKSQTK